MLENVGKGPNYLVLIRAFRINPFFHSYCHFRKQLVLNPILTMFCMVNSVSCTNVTITVKKRIYTENPYKYKIIWSFTNIFQPWLPLWDSGKCLKTQIPKDHIYIKTHFIWVKYGSYGVKKNFDHQNSLKYMKLHWKTWHTRKSTKFNYSLLNILWCKLC